MTSISEWTAILGLIFGGCCSNAWTLELVTSSNPDAGSLITFAQFLFVSLYGLLKHIHVDRSISERRRISKEEVASQVVLDVLEKRMGKVEVKECGNASNGTEEMSLIRTLKVEFEKYGVKVEQQGRVLSMKNTIGAGSSPNKTYTIFLSSQPLNVLPSIQSTSSLFLELSGPSHMTLLIPQSQWNPIGLIRNLRLKERKIPIKVWLLQVVLFFFISLLNNAAFGYAVPMSVHIIFRSGGLVINMIVGWAVGGRRYTLRQVLSVIIVTAGVVLTTLSASQNKRVVSRGEGLATYATGIAILTAALVLSGFLGLAQDRAYTRYGRGREQGEESLFYLHALAMPGFMFVGQDIRQKWTETQDKTFYALLALNVLTQLVCVSGVNQLSGRVTSLTVTLVLAVRKAVSLLISIKHGESWMMWVGAALVFSGTTLYAL